MVEYKILREVWYIPYFTVWFWFISPERTPYGRQFNYNGVESPKQAGIRRAQGIFTGKQRHPVVTSGPSLAYSISQLSSNIILKIHAEVYCLTSWRVHYLKPTCYVFALHSCRWFSDQSPLLPVEGNLSSEIFKTNPPELEPITQTVTSISFPAVTRGKHVSRHTAVCRTAQHEDSV